MERGRSYECNSEIFQIQTEPHRPIRQGRYDKAGISSEKLRSGGLRGYRPVPQHGYRRKGIIQLPVLQRAGEGKQDHQHNKRYGL